MKKKLLGMSAWAVALFTAVVMTGCVSETDEDVSPSTGGSTLTIKINSGSVGATRATNIHDALAVKTSEKMIQTMLVAVFKEDAGDNNIPKLIYYNYLNVNGQSAASGFSTTVDNVSPATQFAAGDRAVIIANVPEEVFTGVKALGTPLATFKATPLTISQALDSDSDGETEANILPMYGEVDITQPASGHLVADVTMGHMITKVTLESLSVNDIPAGNSFKPTQVFLYKVADKMDFGFDFSSTYSFSNYLSPAGTVCDYTGEVTDPAPAHFAAYLGTKVYSDGDGDLATLDATSPTWVDGSSVDKVCVLYAMPNVFASPTEGNDTRLVVKGLWNDGSSESTCYYNFRLLNVVSGVAMDELQYRKFYPNRNYRIKVVLKRKGAASIDAGVDVQANTAVAFNAVSEWGDGEQTTTFGGEGGSTTTTN